MNSSLNWWVTLFTGITFALLWSFIPVHYSKFARFFDQFWNWINFENQIRINVIQQTGCFYLCCNHVSHLCFVIWISSYCSWRHYYANQFKMNEKLLSSFINICQNYIQMIISSVSWLILNIHDDLFSGNQASYTSWCCLLILWLEK